MTEERDPRYHWIEVVDLGKEEPTYIRGSLIGCTCIIPCEFDCDCAVCHGG